MLSSVCYDVILFVVLLYYFIYVRAIRIDKADSISRRYQTMIVSMLNNWIHIYFNLYIIKILGFIPIYYTVNLYIISSFMIFSNFYFILDLKEKKLFVLTVIQQLLHQLMQHNLVECISMINHENEIVRAYTHEHKILVTWFSQAYILGVVQRCKRFHCL